MNNFISSQVLSLTIDHSPQYTKFFSFNTLRRAKITTLWSLFLEKCFFKIGFQQLTNKWWFRLKFFSIISELIKCLLLIFYIQLVLKLQFGNLNQCYLQNKEVNKHCNNPNYWKNLPKCWVRPYKNKK